MRQNELARSCALRGGIYGVERLARGHEQAVTLGAAKGDVTAHLGKADAAEQLAFRRPHRHAAIPDGTAGCSRPRRRRTSSAAIAAARGNCPRGGKVGDMLIVSQFVEFSANQSVRRTNQK